MSKVTRSFLGLQKMIRRKCQKCDKGFLRSITDDEKCYSFSVVNLIWCKPYLVILTFF